MDGSITRFLQTTDLSAAALIMKSSLVLFFTVIINVCFITLAIRQHQALVAWRTHLVVLLRTSRAVLYFFLHANVIDGIIHLYPDSPCSGGSRAVHLIKPVRSQRAVPPPEPPKPHDTPHPSPHPIPFTLQPLYVMLGTIGHALPLLQNILSTLVFAIPVILHMKSACGGESCAEHEQSILGVMRLFGLGRDSIRSLVPSDPRRCCIILNGWLILYGGIVVPLALMYSLERMAWSSWARRRGYSTKAHRLMLYWCGAGAVAFAALPCLFFTIWAVDVLS